MKRLIEAATLAVTLVLLAGTLVGCSSDPAGQTEFCSSDATNKQIAATEHAIVVVGNVANSPAWKLTDQVTTALTKVVSAGGRVDMVSTAGNGYLCPAESLRMEAVDPAALATAEGATFYRDIIARNLKKVGNELGRAPRADGSDIYAALHLAGDQFESIGAQHRLLIVISSGLSDHGDVDFTKGLLGSEPDEMVTWLKHLGPLPSLKGVEAIAVGLGWTAGPNQEPLIDRQRANVRDVYSAILTASHAKVTIDPGPMNGQVIDTLGRSVAPTPLPGATDEPPTGCTPVEEVFGQDRIRFVGDKATFVDPDAAREALTPVANWLADEPSSRTVRIVGTTARATSKANQLKLALVRAKGGRKLLIALGVHPGQITEVKGVGSWFDGYVNDHDSSGNLIPSAAVQNRSLRLLLRQTC